MGAGRGRRTQPFLSPVIRSSLEMLKVFRLPWAGLVSGRSRGFHIKVLLALGSGKARMPLRLRPTEGGYGTEAALICIVRLSREWEACLWPRSPSHHRQNLAGVEGVGAPC